MALATPRLQDAVEADAAALFEYLDTVVAAGVDGVVLFGSTGEFVHFDLPERRRVLALVQKRCRVPLLVNVSHSTLAGAIELAEDALETGVSGLLLMPPYYFATALAKSQSSIGNSRKSSTKGTALSLQHPAVHQSYTGRGFGRIACERTYAGIKDSSGDWQLFEHLRALRRAVAVYVVCRERRHLPPGSAIGSRRHCVGNRRRTTRTHCRFGIRN